MDLFNRAIDAVLKLWFTLWGWAPPILGLTVISLAAGVGMLWVMRRTSNQKRIKQVKRTVAAALLELRVYAEEPAATGRALRTCFCKSANPARWNWRWTSCRGWFRPPTVRG